LLPPNAQVESLPKEALCLADELVIPGFLSRRFAGYLPPAYREWFLDRVAPPRASRRNRRILITRTRKETKVGRAFENEDELLAALEPLGFSGYSLEGLPVAEQVALFHDAEVIVGAHGAGLANALFSRMATVIELFSTPFVTPHYYYLCKGCGHRYRWLYGTEEDRNANFRVDISALLRALADLGV
jgi:capsular polysaccharide biosynthesis protein